jgi:1-acyl-sn-glycerol-3-phosphate acyltransferase
MIRICLALFGSIKIEGRENIPAQGPLIIAANHISIADPPILAASINRRLAFMANETLFEVTWRAWFIRNLGALPVSPERLSTNVLRQVNSALDRGLAMVVFPEGDRSNDYRLMPAKYGAAFIAIRHSIPILPVGITGTEQVKDISCIFHRPGIKVKIGPVFLLPEIRGKLDRDKLSECSATIMNRIAELLPQKYLGDEYKAGK